MSLSFTYYHSALLQLLWICLPVIHCLQRLTGSQRKGMANWWGFLWRHYISVAVSGAAPGCYLPGQLAFHIGGTGGNLQSVALPPALEVCRTHTFEYLISRELRGPRFHPNYYFFKYNTSTKCIGEQDRSINFTENSICIEKIEIYTKTGSVMLLHCY